MSSSSNPALGHQNLAKFAFNIYGTLNSVSSTDGSSPNSSGSSSRSKLYEKPSHQKFKLTYNCEKEVTCLSELNHPLGSNTYEGEAAHHIVIGGKNYLKLLVLNSTQSLIVNEVNILEQSESMYSNTRLPSAKKLNSYNTIKTSHDTIACGLSNGAISIYKISNNGKSSIIQKYNDHKRCINSLDFVTNQANPHQLLSGSQDGSIKLWDLRTASPKPVTTLLSNPHSDPIRSCQYSPHTSSRNKLVVLSVHDSGALCKHDLRQGGNSHISNYTPERKWNFHTGPALSLHIHPKKKYVITGGRDQKMCVWNYDDANNQYKNAPEHVINTYGPVMKVRWCPYASNSGTSGESLSNVPYDINKFDDKLSYDEREVFYDSPNNNSLYEHDFACSYLNEDPTISVYSLKRKYIAKEVLMASTKKSFQNFIWSRNPTQSRNIWTISKSNIFNSYQLDSESPNNVMKPLENLNNVSITWNNNLGDFSFVNQEKSDFEITPSYDSGNIESASYNDSSAISDVQSTASNLDNQDNRLLEMASGGIDSRSGSFSLSRNQGASLPSEIINRANNSFKKSTSPNPHTKGFTINETASGFLPASLHRNSSQSSQGSGLLAPALQVNSNKKHINNQYYSFVTSISLPIPLNDSFVFEALANNYLITVPENRNLTDVCYFNAEIAASLNKLRDSQTWRVLATSLDLSGESIEPESIGEKEMHDSNDNFNDVKSISSDLGNFVGSYNSNSTSTTNYGVERNSESTDSVDKVPIGKQNSNFHSYEDKKNVSGSNVSENINQTRSIYGISISPSATGGIYRSQNGRSGDDKDTVLLDSDLENEKTKSMESLARRPSYRRTNSHPGTRRSGTGPSSPVNIKSTEVILERKRDESLKNLSPSFSRFPHNTRRMSKTSINNEDIDDENASAQGGTAQGSFSTVSSTYSPNYFNQNFAPNATNPNYLFGNTPQGSIPSRRSSIMHQDFNKSFGRYSPRSQALHKDITQGVRGLLDRDERDERQATQRTVESELTKAMNDTNSEKATRKPWSIEYLLEKAIDYSMLQGDVVMASTLSLLFYDQLKLPRDRTLELLWTYIDILKRKMLFETSAKIIKSLPMDLSQELASTKEINLRFFCSICGKLLLNERSEKKAFWYCDECSSRQHNCIYCSEPCKGLNLVTSLGCGHRGHFGCLREWFIGEENTECPGGCDFVVT